MRTSVQVLLAARAPSLIGTFDVPLPSGGSLPSMQPRKVLLFVRAIP
jgi:hypothetical protein